MVSLVVTPRDRLHCSSLGFQHGLISNRLPLGLSLCMLCHELWAEDPDASKQQSCMQEQTPEQP